MGKPTLHVLFVAASGNAKAGPIPVTYSGAQSCPSACPLAKGGCYAKGIRTRAPWDRATAGGPASRP
jgi:hypothetical protein